MNTWNFGVSEDYEPSFALARDLPLQGNLIKVDECFWSELRISLHPFYKSVEAQKWHYLKTCKLLFLYILKDGMKNYN